MKTFDILKKLVDIKSAPGAESEIKAFLKSEMESMGYFSFEDGLGNLLCTSSGNGKCDVVLDAHIDQIAFSCVEVINGGFLRISASGGIDRRTLLCQPVIAYGKKAYKGATISSPPHLSKDDKIPEIDEIFVDLGIESLTEADVPISSPVYFDHPLKEHIGGIVSGTGLDNKASVCALLLIAESLKKTKTNKSVGFLFSTREETGATAAATAIDLCGAEKAIVVDVSFAACPDNKPYLCGKMGEGAMVGIAPIIDKELSKAIRDAADKKGIKYQTEVMSGRTGTNADAIGLRGKGVRVCTVSIPLLSMHSPIERVKLSDVENTAELILEALLNI